LKNEFSSSEKAKKPSDQFHFKSQALTERLPSLQSYQDNRVSMQKKSFSRAKRNMSLEGLASSLSPEKPLRRNNSVFEDRENIPTIKEWSTNDLPYTSSQVLQFFGFSLTTYEKLEIKSYPLIYYIGLGVVKLIPDPKMKNIGFDDERNDLILVRSDHLVYRYEILEIIGRGSYGQVVKAFDHKEKKPVAVKIIRNLNCISKQAKIELSILETLGKINSNNVIRLVDHFFFRNHIIETFELLDVNLYQILRVKKSGIDLEEVRTYAKSILKGMESYDSLGIIHCDLKPENIMLDLSTKRVVIIDFGSACFCNKRLYTYIQSRYYRSPEVVLELGYSFKIDIWSLGCIVTELATGFSLFRGKTEQSLFLSMVEVLGLPPSHMLENSPKCDSIIKEIQTNHKNIDPGSRVLESFLPQDPELISFIKSCLAWDPAGRPSASEALSHDFIKKDRKNFKLSLPEAYNNLSLSIPS
jgi:dual specificity tyrosine-phosphorylation-regulated kinase 2/3/4